MKRDYTQESIKWCNIQRERWGHCNKGKYDLFRDGVISGYGWMKYHLKHIKKKGIKCRCPR